MTSFLKICLIMTNYSVSNRNLLQICHYKMTDTIRNVERKSRIDLVVYIAPLHAILSIKHVWRRARDPSSWIADCYMKERQSDRTKRSH